MRARLLFLTCLLLSLPLGNKSTAETIRESQDDAADVVESVSDTSPMIQLELWVVTLTPDATDEIMSKVSSPVGDRDEVLSRVRDLEKQDLVSRSQYLMTSTLEEQPTILHLGRREPRIQGVSRTTQGRQASAVYEPLGTMLEAKSTIAPSHVIVSFQYEDSYHTPTDVAIFESKDDDSENVNLVEIRQFTHHATVSCPMDGAITVMASRGNRGSGQPATLMFLAARVAD